MFKLDEHGKCQLAMPVETLARVFNRKEMDNFPITAEAINIASRSQTPVYGWMPSTYTVGDSNAIGLEVVT
jgi:hypothetical protein